jgi:hypothetical protein
MHDIKGFVASAAERLDRTVIAQELLPGGYTPQRLVRLRLAEGVTLCSGHHLPPTAT